MQNRKKQQHGKNVTQVVGKKLGQLEVGTPWPDGPEVVRVEDVRLDVEVSEKCFGLHVGISKPGLEVLTSKRMVILMLVVAVLVYAAATHQKEIVNTVIGRVVPRILKE